MSNVNTSTVLGEVVLEQRRQDQRWGAAREQSPYKWLTILSEEVGEAARAVLEIDPSSYREEMIQVAAVAVSAIESFDRQALPEE